MKLNKIFQKNFNNYFLIADVLIVLAIIFVVLHLPSHPPTTAKSLVNAPADAQKILQTCTGQDKQGCFKTQLMAETKTYGLADGEKVLFALQDLDDSAKNCHVLAHYMAREAYKRNPKDFGNLIDSLDVNACGSGFLHGVLEAYTGDHPEIKIDGAFATQICDRGNDEYRKRMCAHFMGHVLLINSYGKLTDALPLCDNIKPEWQFDCYDGLFMEDHQKLALVEHSMAQEPVLNQAYFNSMEQTCRKYDGSKGRACWTEIAEMYAHAYGYNADIIYKGCAKAPTAEEAQACYFKGVVVLVIYDGFDNPTSLLSLCKFYSNNPSLYGGCTQNAISALMYYSPKFAPRGVTLCSSVQSQFQQGCFSQLAGELKTLVPDQQTRSQYCAGIPEAYKNSCIN